MKCMVYVSFLLCAISMPLIATAEYQVELSPFWLAQRSPLSKPGAKPSKPPTPNPTIPPTPEGSVKPPSAKDSFSKLSDAKFSVNSCRYLEANIFGQPNSRPADKTWEVVVAKEPSHGKINLQQGGNFNYTPNPDYNGIDEFAYKVKKGSETSSEFKVQLSINKEEDSALELAPDKHPLIIRANGGKWKAKKDSQPAAFEFQARGKLTIHYKYPSGTFTREGQFKVKDSSVDCPRPIDIIMSDGRALKTIYEIKTIGNDKILRIQLVGLTFNGERPKSITPDGVKEFVLGY
jgi:Bacterial Ig domain